MSTHSSSDRIAMHLHAGDPEPVSRPTVDTPFRMCVLGDFSGRASRGVVGETHEIQRRQPKRVDRDDLDAVLASVQPEVRLDLSGTAGIELTVAVREMEDFHPDRLINRLPTFKALRTSRDKLANPVDQAPPAATPIPDNLLDEILGAASATPAPPAGAADDLDDFVRRVVSPHVQREADAKSDLLASLDEGVHHHMRQVLHDPAFQRLESSWRGVELLTKRLETSSSLQVWLVDISKEELRADLESSEGVETSGLRAVLDGRTGGAAGADPWALLVGSYSFGPEEGDLRLLERLGDLGGRLGAPFVSQGHPALAGYPSISEVDDTPAEGSAPEGWEPLRRGAGAKWVGLLTPRFLGRLPYGEDGEACFEVEFEEGIGAFEHEHLLWLNPAYACALLLAESFSESGWTFRPGQQAEVGGLPAHTYQRDGTTVLTPCAEVHMTDRVANGLLEAGLMPVASLKDQDSVRVVRFQSIADPLAALAGPWTEVQGD